MAYKSPFQNKEKQGGYKSPFSDTKIVKKTNKNAEESKKVLNDILSEQQKRDQEVTVGKVLKEVPSATKKVFGNIIKGGFNLLTSAEQKFGETIAAPFAVRSKSVTGALKSQQDLNAQKNKLVTQILEKKKQGKDTTQLEKVYKNISAQPQTTMADLVPAIKKTGGQIAAEGAETGLDIITAGTFSPALKTAKAVYQAKNLTKLGKVASELKTAAKFGGLPGVGYGALNAIQEQKTAPEVAKSAITGGLVGTGFGFGLQKAGQKLAEVAPKSEIIAGLKKILPKKEIIPATPLPTKTIKQEPIDLRGSAKPSPLDLRETLPTKIPVVEKTAPKTTEEIIQSLPPEKIPPTLREEAPKTKLEKPKDIYSHLAEIAKNSSDESEFRGKIDKGLKISDEQLPTALQAAKRTFNSAREKTKDPTKLRAAFNELAKNITEENKKLKTEKFSPHYTLDSNGNIVLTAADVSGLLNNEYVPKIQGKSIKEIKEGGLENEYIKQLDAAIKHKSIDPIVANEQKALLKEMKRGDSLSIFFEQSKKPVVEKVPVKQEKIVTPEINEINLQQAEAYLKGSKFENILENKKVTPSPKKEIPKEVKSGMFERVKSQLSDEFRDDFTYKRLNLENDAKKAVALIDKDPQKAARIAMGVEGAPKGQTDTAVSIALAEKARLEGNHKLQRDIIMSRVARQIKRGQEIVAEKGSVSENSAERFIKEVVAERLKNNLPKSLLETMKETVTGQKTSIQKVVDKQVQNIKKVIKSVKEIDIEEAQKIIDSLACDY